MCSLIRQPEEVPIERLLLFGIDGAHCPLVFCDDYRVVNGCGPSLLARDGESAGHA